MVIDQIIIICSSLIFVSLFTLLIGFPVDILYMAAHNALFSIKRIFIHGIIVWIFIIIFYLINLLLSKILFAQL